MKKQKIIYLAVLAAVVALLFGCAADVGKESGVGELDAALANAVGAENETGLRTETAAPTTDKTDVGDDAAAETRPAAQVNLTPAATENPAAETEAATKAQRPDPTVKHTAMTSGQIYTDALRTDRDEHWYDFSVPERGVIKYALGGSSKQNLASRTVRLYQQYYVNGVNGEPALRLLDTLQVFAADGDGESPNIGVIPGEYKLLVTSGDVTALSDYALRMTFAPRTDYEIECNDTQTRYTEISSGVQIRGSACFREDGTDTDWFLFRMYRPGAISLRFRHATGTLVSTAFRVTLFNDRFEELYAGVSPFQLGTLESGTLGAAAGVYYVRVENRVYYSGDYGLTVTGAAGGAFETESNNTAAEATPIAVNAVMTGALTQRGGVADTDWYAAAADAPGFVQVSLSADGGGEGKKKILRLTVCDGSGAPLYAATLDDAAKKLTTPAIGLPAGAFLLRVDNDGLTAFSGDYQLEYTLTPDAGAETEPNDTIAAADALRENTTATGVITDGDHGFDTDVFVLSLPKAQKITLYFNHSAAPRDAEIYVLTMLDAKGHALAQTAVSAAQTQTEIPLSLPAGNCYVRISAGLYSDGGGYTLRWTGAKE